MATTVIVTRQRALTDTRAVTQDGAGDVSTLEHAKLPPRVLSAQLSTTDALTAATINTTETAFATSYAIPANTLKAGSVYRVSAILDEVTSGTPVTQLLKLRVESPTPTDVPLYATAAITPTASQSHLGASLVWLLQATAAPGAATKLETGLTAAILAGASALNLANTVAQGVAVDTTVVETLQITLTFGANTSGNVVTLRQLIVEELAQP